SGLFAAKYQVTQNISVNKKTKGAEYTDDDAVMKTFCDSASYLHHFFLFIRKGDGRQQHHGQRINDSRRKKQKREGHAGECSVALQRPGLTAKIRNKHKGNQHIFQAVYDGQRKMVDGQRNTEGEKFPDHSGKRLC